MKLFVGNLPHATTDDELKELFAQFGDVVSARVIKDRETKRSRGFGFVEMGSKDDGDKAISELNESEVGGRAIVVSEARPQEKRENRSFNRDNRRF